MQRPRKMENVKIHPAEQYSCRRTIPTIHLNELSGKGKKKGWESELIGVGERTKMKGKENWKDIRTKVLRNLTESGEGKKRRSERDVRRKATAEKSVQERKSFTIIKGKKFKENDFN